MHLLLGENIQHNMSYCTEILQIYDKMYCISVFVTHILFNIFNQIAFTKIGQKQV